MTDQSLIQRLVYQVETEVCIQTFITHTLLDTRIGNCGMFAGSRVEGVYSRLRFFFDHLI